MPTIEFDDEALLTQNPVFSFDQNTVSFEGETITDADIADGFDMVLTETLLQNSGARGIGVDFNNPVRETTLDIDVGPTGAVVVGYNESGEVIFAEKIDPDFGKVSLGYDSASAGLSRLEMYSDPEEMLDGVDNSSLLDTAVGTVAEFARRCGRRSSGRWRGSVHSGR